MLEIANIRKVYENDSHAAVEDVSLELPAGKIITLLGESGCGKTTLLRMIAGLAVPNEGEIRLNNELMVGPSTWVPPQKRKIGMVAQGGALFPHMTVFKNIAYGLSHLNKNERLDRIRQKLELVGLADKQHRYPHELSGGERQRIALIRALAPSPRLILLDEPFSNLDTTRKKLLRTEVRSILKRENMTAILVSHDPQDARHFGDLIAIMRSGRISQSGTKEEIISHPCNEYCSELIGEIGKDS
ncbi:MAG: ABC transporter ATP-binding protein [Verrucomicrobiota bacterium]